EGGGVQYRQTPNDELEGGPPPKAVGCRIARRRRRAGDVCRRSSRDQLGCGRVPLGDGVAETLERAFAELPDSLTGDAESLADAGEGLGLVGEESTLHDLAVARVELLERLVDEARPTCVRAAAIHL